METSQMVHAVWRNGVFVPKESLDLVEGVEVENEVMPLPDPPIESESEGAPFSLPDLPEGLSVRARSTTLPLPDPID